MKESAKVISLRAQLLYAKQMRDTHRKSLALAESACRDLSKLLGEAMRADNKKRARSK